MSSEKSWRGEFSQVKCTESKKNGVYNVWPTLDMYHVHTEWTWIEFWNQRAATKLENGAA